MNKNHLIIAVIMLVLAGTLSSCGKKNEGEEPVTIIGKWKLVKVLGFIGKTHDYSTCNIVYEFKVNGVLTVSGDVEDTEIFYGHAIGEHSYSIIDPESTESVKIDNRNHYLTISSEDLELVQVFPPNVDGALKYFFVKIN